MSMNDRARQFLPFEALKGLKEALKLKEYEHERIEKSDLSEDEIINISNTLSELKNNDLVEVNYYSNGSYIIAKGNIKLNIVNNYISINKNKILLDDIKTIKKLL